jgi:outer membrane immunogenic protein
MKKIVAFAAAIAAFGFVSSAGAADMPVKAPIMKTAAPVDPWTGCYVGGNAGGGWARKENIDLESVPTNQTLGTHTASGAMAGGQVGCDYHFASTNFVIGIQGLYDWTNLTGSNVDPQNPARVGYSTKISSIASATARVGYLITPALLGFVEGGGTWLGDNHTQFNPTTGGVYAQETQTWVGGTFGGGLEYMFLPNWSVFVKYDYTKFSDKGTTFVGCTTTCITEKLNLQTALVGVNFRFH